VFRAVAVAVALAVVADPLAVIVAGNRFVRLGQLEVGGGGVEEQQVDLEVEEIGDLVEHLLLQVVFHLVQPVHRPVAGLLAHLVQSIDMDVMTDPIRGGELRRRSQSSVGDQAEQHPPTSPVWSPI
jgi:hypothetical protein